MTPQRINRYKLVVTVGFAVAAVCFLLPFLVVSVDERVGRGTGVALATGSADISGRYVHDAYIGQVEDGLGLAELPALIALVAVAVGAAGAWIPRRIGLWVSVAAALGALFALFWLRQTLSSPTLLADVAVRYGYWVSMLLVLLAAAQTGLFLYLTSWSYLNR